jgi:hypothetical protein
MNFKQLAEWRQEISPLFNRKDIDATRCAKSP